MALRKRRFKYRTMGFNIRQIMLIDVQMTRGNVGDAARISGRLPVQQKIDERLPTRDDSRQQIRTIGQAIGIAEEPQTFGLDPVSALTQLS